MLEPVFIFLGVVVIWFIAVRLAHYHTERKIRKDLSSFQSPPTNDERIAAWRRKQSDHNSGENNATK